MRKHFNMVLFMTARQMRFLSLDLHKRAHFLSARAPGAPHDVAININRFTHTPVAHRARAHTHARPAPPPQRFAP